MVSQCLLLHLPTLYDFINDNVIKIRRVNSSSPNAVTDATDSKRQATFAELGNTERDSRKRRGTDMIYPRERKCRGRYISINLAECFQWEKQCSHLIKLVDRFSSKVPGIILWECCLISRFTWTAHCSYVNKKEWPRQICFVGKLVQDFSEKLSFLFAENRLSWNPYPNQTITIFMRSIIKKTSCKVIFS